MSDYERWPEETDADYLARLLGDRLTLEVWALPPDRILVGCALLHNTLRLCGYPHRVSDFMGPDDDLDESDIDIIERELADEVRLLLVGAGLCQLHLAKEVQAG